MRCSHCNEESPKYQTFLGRVICNTCWKVYKWEDIRKRYEDPFNYMLDKLLTFTRRKRLGEKCSNSYPKKFVYRLRKEYLRTFGRIGKSIVYRVQNVAM